ncbi:MAG: YdcH family protein [Pseudoruegeria sp.]
MSVTAHVTELQKKHRDLSDRVENELRSPSSSDIQIAEMKKQKLRLKEEIQRLSTV